MAPKLTRRLVLEEPQRTPDGAGGYAVAWVELGTLWAEVRAGTGREKAVEHLTVSALPVRITVRAAAQGAPSRPRPEQRLRDGARLYRIQAVTESDADARYLVCFAIEEVSA